MLVWVGQEVQEVSRAVGGPGDWRGTSQAHNTRSADQPSARRASAGQRLRDLVLVALVFALGAGAVTAYATFRIWQVGQQDGRRSVDAIVVLGTAQYNGHPSAALAARLDHAIALYKDGYARYLITTGGNRPGDRTTEAETGYCYAIRQGGVPPSAILMENTGSDTRESIENVRAIFDAHGLHTALFVSDRSHMLRVLMLAQDQGIEAWASPTTTSPDDNDPNVVYKSIAHELGGLALYAFVEGGATGVASAAPSVTSARC